MLYISGREHGIDRFYVHGTGFVKRATCAVHWPCVTLQSSAEAYMLIVGHCFIRSRARHGLQDAERPFPTPLTAVILRAYAP